MATGARPIQAPGLNSSVSTEDEGHVYEREEGDHLNETIVALDMRNRGTVGCCYYVAREEKLYFMEDAQLGGLGIIDACKSTRRYGITVTN